VSIFTSTEFEFRCPCSLCTARQPRVIDLRQVSPDMPKSDSEVPPVQRNLPIRLIPRLAETLQLPAVCGVGTGRRLVNDCA